MAKIVREDMPAIKEIQTNNSALTVMQPSKTESLLEAALGMNVLRAIVCSSVAPMIVTIKATRAITTKARHFGCENTFSRKAVSKTIAPVDKVVRCFR